METLRDLHQMALSASNRFCAYDGHDFVLPQLFKDFVKEINSNSIIYNQYSAVIETKGYQTGTLNIFMPNQWFYVASYFTEFYNELIKYKKYALQAVTKERLKLLNGTSLSPNESQAIQALDLTSESKEYLIKFITDYSWWGGAKTIDRGDFYVSPILSHAKLVNASQSFVADLCAFLADKPELVNSIINEEENSIISHQTINLKSALQQIFYGAPGTGKSNTIKCEVEEKKRIHFRTTFHPDSDYSTFVGCYKPTKEQNKTERKQVILDYDALVDKFKEYLNAPPSNITRASTLFGYDFHDSIVSMQQEEKGGHTIVGLVADAYKAGSTYDSELRAGMSVYESSQHEIPASTSITYEFIPQAFTKAYCEAWNRYDGTTESEPVFLIIEEINRGNCAQIFGDIFQLLDRETEGERTGFSTYPIDADEDLKKFLMTGTKEDGSRWLTNEDGIKDGKLCLPPNLYIWATMNTSDQSLFPIDSAFKRRWDWKYIRISEGRDKVTKEPLRYSFEVNNTAYDWWSFLKIINERIGSITSSEDKKLGYFFCGKENGKISAQKFVSKVCFYLWNDVFKDFGFGKKDQSAAFKKENGKDLSFDDFYTEDEETFESKVNETMLENFIVKLGVETVEARRAREESAQAQQQPEVSAE